MTTAVSSELQFDPVEHRYTRNGVIVPGVTDVLKGCGLIDDRWFTDEGKWRGSRVHLACAFDDENDIEESEFTEKELGYLEAWRLFKREMKFLDGAVVDLKTGQILPWVKYQLAAYSEFRPTGTSRENIERPMLYECNGISFAGTPDRLIPPFPALRRIAVRLKPNGKYVPKEFPIHERRGDLNIFLAALAINNAKESNK